MITTIRIPDVLQARIDLAAGKDGRTKWILEACRMRLDNATETEPSRAEIEAKINLTQQLEASLAVTPESNMVHELPHDERRAIALAALANVKVQQTYTTSEAASSEPEVPPVMLCPKIGYDHPDGDPRRCCLQKGHKGACRPGEKVDA